jgi:hypothetical protein
LSSTIASNASAFFAPRRWMRLPIFAQTMKRNRETRSSTKRQKITNVLIEALCVLHLEFECDIPILESIHLQWRIQYYLVDTFEDLFAQGIPLDRLRPQSKEQCLQEFFDRCVQFFSQFSDAFAPKSIYELECKPSRRAYTVDFDAKTIAIVPGQSRDCFDVVYGTCGGLNMGVHAMLIPLPLL